MKIRLTKCCWFKQLRLACIAIGWYLIVFSSLYMAVLPFCKKNERTPTDATTNFLLKYGTYISVPLGILQLAAGVLDLIAVYQKTPLLMLVSIIIYLVFTVGCIPIAIWAVIEGAMVVLYNFTILSGVNVCFEMILFSYYIDMKDRDSQSSSVRGSMFV